MKEVVRSLALLAILSFSSHVVGQELIITKLGDLFLCNTETAAEDSIQFSFLFNDQTYHHSISREMVAYHGKDFFREQPANIDTVYQQDLIVTMNGQVLHCKIISYFGSPDIGYAFLSGGKELTNVIEKREVAFYKKSFRQQVNPGHESLDYYRAVAMTIAQQEARAAWLVSSQDMELIVTKQGELFLCNIDTVAEDSIQFSFLFKNQTYRYSISNEEVAYHGKNFILEPPASKAESVYQQDLIVKNNGEVIVCNIVSYIASAR